MTGNGVFPWECRGGAVSVWRAAAFEIWDPPRRDQAGGLALVLVAPDPRGHAACVIQESYIKHLVRRNAFTTRIQRWWRAIMAEHAFGWVHKKLSEAALKVQRVYRGHKGRDLAAKCHGVQACADLWFSAIKVQKWIRPVLERLRAGQV